MAQQPGKLPTIGFFGQTTRSAASEWTAALEIRRAQDVAPAVEALKGRADALYVCIDALVNANRIRINTSALGVRLPTMHGSRDYVEAGGLMSYGPNYPDLFRRTGDYVDKILRGAKAADIPVEQPTKFDLIINLTTAKARPTQNLVDIFGCAPEHVREVYSIGHETSRFDVVPRPVHRR